MDAGHPSLVYRELVPPARLKGLIECVWTLQANDDFCQNVLPDGCTDLLLRNQRGGPFLDVVGVMTRSQEVRAYAGDSFIGIRLRPGVAGSVLPVSAGRITDQIQPLAAYEPERARRFAEKLARADHPSELLALVETFLEPAITETRVQRAIDLQVAHHGTRPLEELYDVSGLGPRQFRRVCMDRTGLTPKLLSRILRFRHVAQALENRSRPDLASLALESGYSDQAHMNHEFRVFAGASPTRHRLIRNP